MLLEIPQLGVFTSFGHLVFNIWFCLHLVLFRAHKYILRKSYYMLRKLLEIRASIYKCIYLYSSRKHAHKLCKQRRTVFPGIMLPNPSHFPTKCFSVLTPCILSKNSTLPTISCTQKKSRSYDFLLKQYPNLIQWIRGIFPLSRESKFVSASLQATNYVPLCKPVLINETSQTSHSFSAISMMSVRMDFRLS